MDKIGQKIADRHLDISDLDSAGSLAPVPALSLSSKVSPKMFSFCSS